MKGGLDGINLAYHVSPGSFEDFIEFVVPELQKRGRYRTSYEGETLRESLFGKGQTKVADSHPAAKYRAPTWVSPPRQTPRHALSRTNQLCFRVPPQYIENSAEPARPRFDRRDGAGSRMFASGSPLEWGA